MRSWCSRFLIVTALLAPVAAQAGQTGEREFTTDRPSRTESPYTVDRGRMQVEFDFATFSRDRSDDATTREWSVLPVNLKLGISPDTDVQMIVEPYRHQSMRSEGQRSTVSGFGDVTLRMKHNFFGNDGGALALGVMPFVKLPTAGNQLGNGKVEGGVILPVEVKLTDKLDLNAMTEVDLAVAEESGRYRAGFVNSAALGFDLTDRLNIYTELYTAHVDAWEVTGDAGVTLKVGEDTQLDAGVNIGLSEAADDVMVFAGLSRRF